MGLKLLQVIDRIRSVKGSFFTARLALRLKFDPAPAEDSEANLTELIEVARELGYDLRGMLERV